MTAINGFSEDDKLKLKASYRLPDDLHSATDLLDNSFRYVFYESQGAQFKRFEVLCSISRRTGQPLTGSSILDVGCGLGDLYRYLQSISSDFDYLGVDLSDSYLRGARQLNPQVCFKELDIMTEPLQSYDYVMASGIFSDKVTDNETHLFTMLNRMLELAKGGVAFNFLPRQSRFAYRWQRLRHKLSANRHIVYDTPQDIDIGELYFYDKRAILRRCQSLPGVRKAYLIANYLPGDATIHLIK